MTNRIRGISAIAAAGLLLAVGVANAQDSTTGAVRGIVKDKATTETVVGATVVATSPALKGQQTVLTDAEGAYFMSSLPPGMYEISVYFGDSQFSRKNVLVRVGKVSKVNVTIDSAAAGEQIVIEGRTTIIDQDSTKTGTTITQDYTDNVPTGRTFGAVLGTAAGSQGDTYGVSFGGSTSVENTYIVEGVNTTDPGLGLQSTNLPNEFIRETEVITGGYEAEYGRSTGGVINVVTKSGSNEFHGSVFGYWTPGALTASADATPSASSAVDFESNLDNSFDLGAEIGGPIVKDKVWFHVGINPSFSQSTVDRIIKRRVDNDGTPGPDIDENGFEVFEELSRSNRDQSSSQYYYTGKLTGAINQDNQGSISILGSPSSSENYLGGAGTDSSRELGIDRNIFDGSVKWTSKFNDSASQVDVVLGYHYDSTDQKGLLDGGEGRQIRYEGGHNLTDFMELDPDGVPAECANDITGDFDGDGVEDSAPACPVAFYRVGGLGFLQDTTATRGVASASFTQRVRAAGQHRFKVGADIENQGYKDARQYSGGGFFRSFSGFWRVRRFYTVDDNGTEPCGSDINGDGAPDANCAPVDVLNADTQTRNLGAYAQDTWAILPNLTVNLGLRWEQQTLFTGKEVRGQIDPTSGEPIPDKAFTLNNMIAPRVGVSYDWTQEGRSKLFGHWGRFYESIPMDINDRAYGGEVLSINFIAPCDTSAGATGPGSLSDPTCDEANPLLGPFLLGGGTTLVDPELKAQYLDESILGVEYEPEMLRDFKVTAQFVHRTLGRVIEDVSTDGANTYVVANPGTTNQSGVDDLRAQADAAAAAGDMGRADFLNFTADQFENIGIFDAPKRDYNALVLKADKRFSKNFFLQASYTYSKLKGNYPGLFSPETGQLDPNLTSMYDLPELMANRFGDLAADRPHLLKLDGYYRASIANVGAFTFGGRIRASSGIAHNTLGGHPVYGLGESYILPRGEEIDFVDANGESHRYGRSPFATRFDTHVAYKRMLTDTVGLEAFFDIFNLFNQQPEADKDENYTFDSVLPIVGGSSEDLAHLKVVDDNTGLTSANTPSLNPNFGHVSSRQAPLSMRFGLRMTF